MKSFGITPMVHSVPTKFGKKTNRRFWRVFDKKTMKIINEFASFAEARAFVEGL